MISSDNANKAVERLVDLGICTVEAINNAKTEAEKLMTPAYEARLRHLEKYLGAIAGSTRLRIIYLLSIREMCVCELESALKLSQSTTSHHLSVLEQTGILQRKRRSRRVFY
ncbi:Bacterial regulatory protein, ArsR domain protein, partial [mine drainage metagenome]